MSVKYAAVLLIVVSSLVASLIQAEGAESAGLQFYGKVESYAEYEPWNWRVNATLQFFFRTKSKKKSGLIFYQDDDGKNQFMDLFLINGREARFRAKVQGMDETEKRVIRHDFADSKWHQVKIEFSEKEIKLSIDTEDTQSQKTKPLKTKPLKIYKARPIVLTQYAESLDNAALYFGGIPTDNQGWTNPEIFYDVYLGDDPGGAVFEGCIGDIRFNRAPNGRLERAKLRHSKKATNTCKGDCEKRPDRCANNGRCIDLIRDSECDCRETEYEGRSCEKDSTVVFMNGNGAYISYKLHSDSPLRSTERNELEFRFLTEAKDGVFFYMGGEKDHLLVELVNGSLRVQADFGGGPVVVQSKGNILSDSCWHYVEIRRKKRRLTALIDLGKSGTYNANSKNYTTLNLDNQSIYFGGVPSMELRFARPKRLSFKGYLQKFRFEGFGVLEDALQKRNGFSQTGVVRIWPYNVLFRQAKEKCEAWGSGCSPSEDDSDNCNPSTSPPTTSTQTTTASPTTTTTLRAPPKKTETQPPPKTAKQQKPTPRPKGVSAWVIVVIVLAAMAVVFISVYLLYRWNHRYTGSFKPSKNGEGQMREPGVEPTEQQNARMYNQPVFYMYKPPKKPPTAESPVSI